MNTDTLCCSIFTVIYVITLIITEHTILLVFKMLRETPMAMTIAKLIPITTLLRLEMTVW